MFDVSEKIKTLRTARAVARIKVSPETIERIKRKEIEKGDIFEVTRAVAPLSAKKTSEILPFATTYQLNGWDVMLKFKMDFWRLKSQ
jgi:cyclic pyranopterin monophosphate synthase